MRQLVHNITILTIDFSFVLIHAHRASPHMIAWRLLSETTPASIVTVLSQDRDIVVTWVVPSIHRL